MKWKCVRQRVLFWVIVLFVGGYGVTPSNAQQIEFNGNATVPLGDFGEQQGTGPGIGVKLHRDFWQDYSDFVANWSVSYHRLPSLRDSFNFQTVSPGQAVWTTYRPLNILKLGFDYRYYIGYDADLRPFLGLGISGGVFITETQQIRNGQVEGSESNFELIYQIQGEVGLAYRLNYSLSLVGSGSYQYLIGLSNYQDILVSLGVVYEL